MERGGERRQRVGGEQREGAAVVGTVKEEQGEMGFFFQPCEEWADFRSEMNRRRDLLLQNTGPRNAFKSKRRDLLWECITLRII